MKDYILEASKAIKEADYLLISAGAGMGVDSGLPDFRGVEGFWRAYPIAKKLGLRFEELANPKWFRENPQLAWAFYGHRLNLYRQTKPHIGFKLLLDIAKSKKDYFVFTSNVDGQFQKAGYDVDKILEIHGSIFYLQCVQPCCNSVWRDNNLNISIDEEKFLAKEPLPKCRFCNDIARVNILMFNDYSFIDNRVVQQRKRFNEFLNRANNLVIIEFGAGLSVPTVRLVDEDLSNRFNAKLIRVNPREPQGANIPLRMGAKEAIENIYSNL